MIIDTLITFIYDFVMGFLGPLDQLNNLTIDPYIVDSINDFVGFVAYLIPLRRLMPIVTVFLAIQVWRIAITLVKTIWAALPFV